MFWLIIWLWSGRSSCSCWFGRSSWCGGSTRKHWPRPLSNILLPGIKFILLYWVDPSSTFKPFISYCHIITLQVLNIPTKINKGTVEIITPVELIKKGDKVGSSEAALLAKLGIRPFSYGLVVLSVYDNGSVFSPEVLDLMKISLRSFMWEFPWSLPYHWPFHTQPWQLHPTCSSMPTCFGNCSWNRVLFPTSW